MFEFLSLYEGDDVTAAAYAATRFLMLRKPIPRSLVLSNRTSLELSEEEEEFVELDPDEEAAQFGLTRGQVNLLAKISDEIESANHCSLSELPESVIGPIVSALYSQVEQASRQGGASLPEGERLLRTLREKYASPERSDRQGSVARDAAEVRMSFWLTATQTWKSFVHSGLLWAILRRSVPVAGAVGIALALAIGDSGPLIGLLFVWTALGVAMLIHSSLVPRRVTASGRATCLPLSASLETPEGPVLVIDLKPGDVVDGIVRGRRVRSRVTAKRPIGERPVVEVCVEESVKLVATQHHSVLTREGWRRVGELAPGLELARSNGEGKVSYSRILWVAPLLHPQPIALVHTSAPHTYISNGFVLHSFSVLRRTRSTAQRLVTGWARRPSLGALLL